MHIASTNDTLAGLASWAFAAAFAIVLGLPSVVHAALAPRAGGTMFYDTVLDITWMANANAIAGTPFDDGAFNDDGRVSWNNALAWADALVFGGFDDWRLPSVAPLNGTNFVLTAPIAYDGSKDRGYNVSAPGSAYPYSTASELAYMFHINLGNLGYYALDATASTDPPQPGWGLTNTGPFANLQADIYWTNTVYPLPNWAFRFDFDLGVQLGDDTTQPFNTWRAWAVRDGDVAVVPEPAGLSMVGAALAGLIWIRRRHAVMQ